MTKTTEEKICQDYQADFVWEPNKYIDIDARKVLKHVY